MGAKKLKPSLDCVEKVANGYIAHFAWENANSTPVFVPIGPDNKLTALGSYTGKQPELFNPGTGKFDIFFDGLKLIWELRTFEVNQKTSVATEASSSSAKCPGKSITSNNAAGQPTFKVGAMRSYPNPVLNKVTIQFDDNSGAIKTILGVYDAQGRRQVINQITRTTANSIVLNLGNLKPGWYTIRVMESDEVKTIKIIKK